MCKKLIYLVSFVLIMALATVAGADWVAYNDGYDGNGGTAALGLNVTTHTYLDTNAALMDFDTGATLPVTITMEIVGDGNSNGDVHLNGDNCDAGTEADEVFGGILDLNGGNELDNTTEHKAIIFNGLNPDMSYTITLTTNRANAPYTDRWARVTIEGADAYTYAASAGVNKLSEESGEFCVGYNTVTGYVMKWAGISCGADGSFSIKSENAGYGGKGYAMMAFKLEEYSAIAAEPSLVGWWPLNEGSGDIAVDLSGSGNDGTINNLNGGLGLDGSVWVDDPERGTVISFNGTADGAFVRAGDIPQMTLTNDFTWSFWAKHNAENTEDNDIIFGNRMDENAVDFVPRQFIKFTPTKFEWHMNGNGDDNLDYDDIPADVWLHHAVVKTADQLTYYRNGFEASSGTFTQPLDFPQPLFFGGDNEGSSGENWSGLMSEVRIYDGALTGLEILAIVKGVEQIDMEIGFAGQPLVIDGEVDGIWADASTQYFVPLDDPANASGSWQVLYDSENLYVIIDMTDDSLQNDSASSWQDDSVELYFDGGNTKVNTPLSGDDHQYTFGWTTDDIQGTNIDGYTEGIEHAQVDTDTGWRIEIKLPWLSLQGAEPQAGDLIGIDCYYNDDDDGGDSRENKLLSFSTVEGWNDASQWGTAILAADKRVDVTAPGDAVQGVPNDGLMDGNNFGWPGAETPDLATDDDIGTKFLHFKGELEPTGFQVTPTAGPSIVTGLTLTTANDAVERDPVTFELSGSNEGIDGPYELIASGDIVDFAQADAWPRFTMNATPISFNNDVAYAHYQVLFPALRDAASANSMQIAEVELLGMPAGPVAHWKLDDGEGTVAVDSSGNGNDGVLVGDPQWVAGTIGAGALEFAGISGQHVEIEGYDGILGTQNRTVMAWVKTTGYGDWISWGQNVNSQKWIGRVNDNAGNGAVGALRTECSGGYIISTTVLTDGEWHHITSVLESAGSPTIEDITMYVDGVQEAISGVRPVGIDTVGGRNVWIADGHHDRPLLGLIDDVRLYDRALSAGEIGQLAGTPVEPGTDGLVAFYALDGDTTDSSGNGNDGTIVGASTFVDGPAGYGMAMEFDGESYVDCGNDASLDILGPISIALWIRPGADDPEGQATTTAPMAKADGGMSPSWSWQVRYGWNSPQPYMAFTFNSSPRAWVYVGKNLERDEWAHIACSHDGTTLKCYLNGEQTDSTPMGAITSSSTPVLIGSDGWRSDWIGTIDEVAIYNRDLSVGEIRYLAGERAVDPVDPSLVIYYSFDEVSDIVADQSGKGHDGVVVGDVTAEPEGMYNGAANFASGSYLDLDGPGFPAEDIPTSAMTLAAWIKCANTGGDHEIFSARASDNTWLIHPEPKSSGDIRWLLRSYGGTTIFQIRAGTMMWDEWLHFAGTYDKDAGKAALYINGELIEEIVVENPADIAGDWDLGARVGYTIDNARPFTGLMDEFRMYTRALSQDEILTIMQGM